MFAVGLREALQRLLFPPPIKKRSFLDRSSDGVRFSSVIMSIPPAPPHISRASPSCWN